MDQNESKDEESKHDSLIIREGDALSTAVRCCLIDRWSNRHDCTVTTTVDERSLRADLADCFHDLVAVSGERRVEPFTLVFYTIYEHPTEVWMPLWIAWTRGQRQLDAELPDIFEQVQASLQAPQDIYHPTIVDSDYTPPVDLSKAGPMEWETSDVSDVSPCTVTSDELTGETSQYSL